MRLCFRCCIRCIRCSFVLLPMSILLLFLTALSPLPTTYHDSLREHPGYSDRNELSRELLLRPPSKRMQSMVQIISESNSKHIGRLEGVHDLIDHLKQALCTNITIIDQSDKNTTYPNICQNLTQDPLKELISLDKVPNSAIRRVDQPLRLNSGTWKREIEKRGDCENTTYLSVRASDTYLHEYCRNYSKKKAEFYSRRDHKVNPFQHSFLISGDDICNSDTDIILLIHSLHTHNDRRTSIRNTWGGAVQNDKWPGKSLHKKLKLAFIFGTHDDAKQNALIRHESKQFNDVIQGTFREHYNNMTLKSLLGLKFVSTYCKGARYLLKSDDDMFINFPHMYELFDRLDMKRAIMGPLCIGSLVNRRGKWGVSQEQFPFYFYPPYEAGSAYVITTDIVGELFDTAEYVPHIFIDDVYITGILGKIVNATHIRQGGFAFAISGKPRVADIISNKILTGTRITPSYQVQLWSELVNRLA